MVIISFDTETLRQLNFWYIQKQSPTAVLWKRCSSKFCKFPPVRSLFFNKMVGLRLRPTKRLQRRCFLVNFAKFLRTTTSYNTCGRLLLHISKIFMTANFSLGNYDVINSFNIWKRWVLYWETSLFLITLNYRSVFLIFFYHVYWHVLIYIFYLVYTYSALLKKYNI